MQINDRRRREAIQINDRRRPDVRALDVLFDAPSGVELRADVYVPEHVDRPPVVLWLHGGAWKFGDRKMAPDLERYFTARGLAMVSVDYRLSHQARFPAAVEDTKTAIRWIRNVASTYGWDERAVGLWGSSAGAHLAMMAALTDGRTFTPTTSRYRDHSSAVQAVVAGYTPVDFLQMDEQREAGLVRGDDPESIRIPPGTRTADADSPESSLIGAPVFERPDLARLASPSTYVSATAPPTLLVHGRADAAVPWQQSELLFGAMAAAGHDVTLALVEGLGHGFFNRTHLDDGREWRWEERQSAGRMNTTSTATVTGRLFDRVERFLRTHLQA